MKCRDTTASFSLSAPCSKVSVRVIRLLLRGSRYPSFEIELPDRGLPVSVLVFLRRGLQDPISDPKVSMSDLFIEVLL
jgi:hypothetical protein